MVFVARKGVWHYDATAKTLAKVFGIPRGSRPLSLCHAADGKLYFGDYFGNPGRAPVRIYAATYPALDFEPVYTFPAGAIRHVHGVFEDPFADALWVTTGDIGQEAAIWRTEDQFGTLKPVLRGGQQYRAVTLLFTTDHVYFGTDTPLEQNYICRFNRLTGVVERLVAVQGSVFHGCKVGEVLVFSTAVEPSKVNTASHAYIWASRDGVRWTCLKGYRKDCWPLKLFQYGQILFPSGINSTETLWYTPLATVRDQTLQKISLERIP